MTDSQLHSDAAHISTATARVGVFSSGDADLFQTIVDAGLEIAYLYDTDFGTEHVAFEDIPCFDLVVADLPDGEERKRTFELVLMFLRARTPVSFVLVGQFLGGEEFPASVCRRTEELGYRIDRASDGRASQCKNLAGGCKRRTFIVGTLRDRSFVWPPGIIPPKNNS